MKFIFTAALVALSIAAVGCDEQREFDQRGEEFRDKFHENGRSRFNTPAGSYDQFLMENRAICRGSVPNPESLAQMENCMKERTTNQQHVDWERANGYRTN